MDAFIDSEADILISAVAAKVQPIFLKKTFCQEEKRGIYRYLFSRCPKKVPPSMKNRLINLYDPMADRCRHFKDGLRWCLNTYVGCENACGYCYVNGYSRENVGISPHCKSNFEKKLLEDLKDLEKFNVPVAPLHISNSTDPLQNHLEITYRHTRFALCHIIKNRNQFTSVTILTKNPEMLCDESYLSIIKQPEMKPFTVQITCAFWRDEARRFFEPNAPSVKSRLKALGFLAQHGIDIEIRIDPLFPSRRIDLSIAKHKPLESYLLPEAQTHTDIENLVQFAKGAGVRGIIGKTLKVPVSNRAKQCKEWFGDLYRDASGGQRSTKGGSWRLPDNYQEALISTVSDICRKTGVHFKHCMTDIRGRK